MEREVVNFIIRHSNQQINVKFTEKSINFTEKSVQNKKKMKCVCGPNTLSYKLPPLYSYTNKLGLMVRISKLGNL